MPTMVTWARVHVKQAMPPRLSADITTSRSQPGFAAWIPRGASRQCASIISARKLSVFGLSATRACGCDVAALGSQSQFGHSPYWENFATCKLTSIFCVCPFLAVVLRHFMEFTDLCWSSICCWESPALTRTRMSVVRT